MTAAPTVPFDVFNGEGLIPLRDWHKREEEVITWTQVLQLRQSGRPLPAGHPGAYHAGDAVVDAVNTALALKKPLLLTGRPGTGKSELAERIAYELNLGAVLRFEAQSLSEAGDLFYRFDFVGHMIAGKLAEAGHKPVEEARPIHFVQMGPLGRAILRSAAGQVGVPSELAETGSAVARRSVVLIDEIDKASRDFPNDLLNGIDRMSFTLREVGNAALTGAGRETEDHPIVIITSNSERELPDPFLRRCVYCDVPNPSRQQLASIVATRVLGLAAPPAAGGNDGLPQNYSRLLDAFVDLRDQQPLHYRIGTTELLDLCTVLNERQPGSAAAGAVPRTLLERAVSAIAKHPKDRDAVLGRLQAALAAAG